MCLSSFSVFGVFFFSLQLRFLLVGVAVVDSLFLAVVGCHEWFSGGFYSFVDVFCLVDYGLGNGFFGFFGLWVRMVF